MGGQGHPWSLLCFSHAVIQAQELSRYHPGQNETEIKCDTITQKAIAHGHWKLLRKLLIKAQTISRYHPGQNKTDI